MADQVKVLVTIGNSDLTLGGLELSALRDGDPRARHTRPLGEWVLQEYAAFRDQIATPIVERVQDWVEATFPGASTTYYLVATNQPEHNPDGSLNTHWKNDTVHAAEVIARHLREEHRLDVRTGGQDAERDADLLWVRAQPQDYATQYREWDGRLRRLKRRARDAHLVVCATGGIPAVGWAIMLRSVQHFRSECSVVYVPYLGEGRSGPAEPVPIDTGYWREEVARTFPGVLDAGQYGEAQMIARRSPFCFLAPTVVQRALAARNARLEFNFPAADSELAEGIQALHALSMAARDHPAVAQLGKAIADERATLALLLATGASRARETARLRELYRSALHQYRLGHYADFLARYIALLDQLLAYLVCLVADRWFDTPGALRRWLQGEVAPTLDPKRHQAAIRVIQNLPTDPATEAQAFRRCYDDLMPAVVGDGTIYQRLDPIRRYVNYGGNWRLNDLRNESQVAHGFTAVDAVAIDSRYGRAYFAPDRPYRRGDFGLDRPDQPAPAALADLAHALAQVAAIPTPLPDDLASALRLQVIPAWGTP